MLQYPKNISLIQKNREEKSEELRSNPQELTWEERRAISQQGEQERKLKFESIAKALLDSQNATSTKERVIEVLKDGEYYAEAAYVIIKNIISDKNSVLFFFEILGELKMSALSASVLSEIFTNLGSIDIDKISTKYLNALEGYTLRGLFGHLSSNPEMLIAFYKLLQRTEYINRTQLSDNIIKTFLGLKLDECKVSEILLKEEDIVMLIIKTNKSFWLFPAFFNLLPKEWLRKNASLFEDELTTKYTRYHGSTMYKTCGISAYFEKCYEEYRYKSEKYEKTKRYLESLYTNQRFE